MDRLIEYIGTHFGFSLSLGMAVILVLTNIGILLPKSWLKNETEEV